MDLRCSRACESFRRCQLVCSFQRLSGFLVPAGRLYGLSMQPARVRRTEKEARRGVGHQRQRYPQMRGMRSEVVSAFEVRSSKVRFDEDTVWKQSAW